MSRVVIFTKSPVVTIKSKITEFKGYVRFLLGQRRGPDIIISSLIAGLRSLKVDFLLNPVVNEVAAGSHVYVNESIDALRWAIAQKRAGKISKLVVGPIMTMLPTDYGGIMKSPEIDYIFFPSRWPMDFWGSLDPKLMNKSVIWPASVSVSNCSPDISRNLVLIYAKQAPELLLRKIVNFLDNKEIAYKIIRYGYYRHGDYLDALSHSRVAIFLSPSESQGLAMFEAWGRSVPTIVWNRKIWTYKSYIWKDDKISCPYLTSECGVDFSDFDDFCSKWEGFYSNKYFHPREYVLNNFSEKIIAKKFLDYVLCKENQENR